MQYRENSIGKFTGRNGYFLHVVPVAFVAFFVAFPVCAQTNSEVRDRMIQQSIASYSGSCPCPFNRASNGSRCGGRSAYSRPGGSAPYCFHGDISDEAVERYRQTYGLNNGSIAIAPDEIRKLQQALNAAGYKAGAEDGLMGPQTRRALMQWQRDGQPPLGHTGLDDTIERLLN
ncbi:peptidoglycan-binding domain-containing protein [Martelella radicis]|uniref:Peptidoglycan binding-like domain-containing protein n=1 Tax=Martelella radicis TaxID=1397476 RepID=A0A7W6KMD0_9HYPH|nr:peptidoglycan-binding domain-containing protein [Martelella radicis]MBB4123974.1 hypothetical protein [Martelella radicis]